MFFGKQNASAQTKGDEASSPGVDSSRDKHRRRLIIITATVAFAVALFSWAFWPRSGSANVNVEFSHFENVPGGQVAVFQVSNTGRIPVTMYGARSVWPMWVIASLNGTNRVSESSPEIEFRLASPIVLQPGANVPMPTLLPPYDRWVVGVQYSTAPYARVLPDWARGVENVETFVKRRMSIAWSKPISRSSEASRIVAPLGLATNDIRVNQ